MSCKRSSENGQAACSLSIDGSLWQPPSYRAEVQRNAIRGISPSLYVATVVSRIFRTFNLAERHPALGHAVMAPLICWSFSNSMFRYLLVDHAVPAMWLS